MKQPEKNKKLDKLAVLRHSTSHVLAAAVLEMFPEAKFAIGPAIDDGFYYDFELPRTLIPEDLPLLEEKMKAIIKANHPFKKKMMKVDEAIKHFKKADQPYKVELIKELQDKKEDGAELSSGYPELSSEDGVMIYKSGSFIDLCSGPHLESTGEIRPEAIKLTKISGAYWRGDEKRQQLQRIYGTAFETKKELKKYLYNMEEAKKRNHRKIGKELELFANFPEIGQGLPIWLPNGYTVRRILEDYMLKLEQRYDYQHILTPVINKKELFETSGHLGFYNDSMYSPIEIDEETFYLKPMNCPAGMMVYNMKLRSYRDLPFKLGEFGTVHRYEKSGELHGLQRVRGFTQNDAHIFCTPKQLEKQLVEVMEILNLFYKDLGFDNYSLRLSLKDDSDKYIGRDQDWKKSENIMRKVLKNSGKDFIEEKGEAVFYGPKVDVQAVNVFGKEDTISTIQIDFNLPERFDLNFIDEKGEKQKPFVIHRALIGSFERFFAFLIEHYAGKFPVWLAPVQAIILPVSEKFADYAELVHERLKKDDDIRVELDDSDESLGKRIAKATKQKAPYILVVGEKEEKGDAVAVRERDGEKPHSAEASRGRQTLMKTNKFVERVKKEVEEKK